MNYGTRPEKVASLLTPVAKFPETSGFIIREYINVPDFIHAVILCPQATTAPPTTVAPSTMQAPTIEALTTEAPTTEAPTTEATECSANEKVVDHVCMECPAGKTSTDKHDASGNNTQRDAGNEGWES